MFCSYSILDYGSGKQRTSLGTATTFLGKHHASKTGKGMFLSPPVYARQALYNTITSRIAVAFILRQALVKGPRHALNL